MILIIDGAIAYNGDKKYYDIIIDSDKKMFKLCLKGEISQWRRRRYKSHIDKTLFLIHRKRDKYLSCISINLCDIIDVTIRQYNENINIIIKTKSKVYFLYIDITKHKNARKIASLYKKLCRNNVSTQP